MRMYLTCLECTWHRVGSQKMSLMTLEVKVKGQLYFIFNKDKT